MQGFMTLGNALGTPNKCLLSTYMAQLGAFTSTKIAKNETLPRQRRLMFGIEPAMYPAMDAPPIAIGTICKGSGHLAMDWAGQTHALGTYVALLGAASSTKIAKMRPSQGKEG